MQHSLLPEHVDLGRGQAIIVIIVIITIITIIVIIVIIAIIIIIIIIIMCMCFSLVCVLDQMSLTQHMYSTQRKYTSNTNGVTAKVMTFDRLGKKVRKIDRCQNIWHLQGPH